jgi:hypothetical protein
MTNKNKRRAIGLPPIFFDLLLLNLNLTKASTRRDGSPRREISIISHFGIFVKQKIKKFFLRFFPKKT